MKKLKAAVIGVGNIGRHHARIYKHLQTVQLEAVCDLNEKTVLEIAQKFKIKPFADYAKMLNQLPEIDLVSIAVPTKHHRDIACFFLKNKISVLLEKPIAESLSSAKEIINTAQKNNTSLFIGHVERFNPAVIRLKQIIQENKLGKILSIIARRVGLYPPNVADTNVFLDLAVHDIDVVNFLLGEKPNYVYKHSSKYHTKTRQDAGEMFLVYNDCAVFIQANWITPVKIRSLTVTGTKGYAELDYIRQTLNIYQAQKKTKFANFLELVKLSKTSSMKIKIQKEEPLKKEIECFINGIINKTPPAVAGEDALCALRIVLQ